MFHYNLNWKCAVNFPGEEFNNPQTPPKTFKTVKKLHGRNPKTTKSPHLQTSLKTIKKLSTSSIVKAS